MIYFSRILNDLLIKYFPNQVKEISYDEDSYYLCPHALIVFKNGETKQVHTTKFGIDMMDENKVRNHIKQQLLSFLPYNDRKMREIYG